MPFKKGEIPKGAKPFEPGVSGNPNGAKRKLPELDVMIREVMGGEESETSGVKSLLESLLKQALKGDTRAAQILLDRGYGKVKENITIDGGFVLSNKITFK